MGLQVQVVLRVGGPAMELIGWWGCAHAPLTHAQTEISKKYLAAHFYGMWGMHGISGGGALMGNRWTAW